MSTATLTLVDFLYARIAEDEKDAIITWGEGDWPWKVWILRECEAKRRIVEDQASIYEAHNLVLQLLAQSYADYPDYRQEWTP